MLVKSTRSEGHTSHSLKKSSSLVLFFEGETTGGEKTKGEDQVLYIYIYIKLSVYYINIINIIIIVVITG